METAELYVSRKSIVFSKADLPELDFSHIRSLTDDTGMIQHAMFGMPNRKEGYCIDDNARALLLMVWACKDKKNKMAFQLLPTYLSYIHYMQGNDGYFRNFMTYSKHILEERGSEDSFGRTVMALGFLANEGNTTLLVRSAAEMFGRAYPHIQQLKSIRAIANSIIGLCQFVKYNYPDDLKVNLVIRLADKLTKQYAENKSPDWQWFEDVLTYDNAMLPLSLLNAYEITQDESYLQVAFESMQFLESKVIHNGIVRPVGNNGWCSRNGVTAQYDQQPIDVMAMVLYYQQAFRLTRDRTFLQSMYNSYQWFLGKNDKLQPLFDQSTGGCADGLLDEGVNLNQGAESTLAYWLSHVVVMAALEE
jgi:hypothetical protein